MSSKISAVVLIAALLSFLAGAHPARAGVHIVRGYRGYYGHPHVVRYYGHPHFYHGYRGWTSFHFGAVYAPAPVFVAPPPVVYYAPPVVVQPPAVVQPPPAVEQEPAPQPAPVFVETNRRYHKHGDNKGKLDWVEGVIDGQPIRYYYDDFGRVKKQEWRD